MHIHILYPAIIFNKLFMFICPRQVFRGNNRDRNELVGNTIDPPIIARFIQIRVKTYKGYTGMRAELYGCSDGKFVLQYTEIMVFIILTQ